MKRSNRAQFSPCVIAKVRDAFLVANNYNRNKKRCSKSYWDEACDKLGLILSKSNKQINNAKDKFDLYN